MSILFINLWFNDAQTIQHQIMRRLLNKKLQKMWKEAAVAQFQVLYHQSSGQNEKCHENLEMDNLTTQKSQQDLMNVKQKYHSLTCKFE